MTTRKPQRLADLSRIGKFVYLYKLIYGILCVAAVPTTILLYWRYMVHVGKTGGSGVAGWAVFALLLLSVFLIPILFVVGSMGGCAIACAISFLKRDPAYVYLHYFSTIPLILMTLAAIIFVQNNIINEGITQVPTQGEALLLNICGLVLIFSILNCILPALHLTNAKKETTDPTVEVSSPFPLPPPLPNAFMPECLPADNTKKTDPL